MNTQYIVKTLSDGTRTFYVSVQRWSTEYPDAYLMTRTEARNIVKRLNNVFHPTYTIDMVTV